MKYGSQSVKLFFGWYSKETVPEQLLMIPDGSIREVYSEMIQSDIEGKCLVHCSGALSSMVFSGISERGAKGCSIHPICAVSNKLTGYQELSKAYFTIEGKDVKDLADLAKLKNPDRDYLALSMLLESADSFCMKEKERGIGYEKYSCNISGSKTKG